MKCENCSAEITFWMALRTPTPFRFKCPKCKTKYRVSTPGMKAIFLGTILASCGLSFGFVLGTFELGAVFAVPYVLLVIGLWLLLEVWTCKYMSKYATLTRVGVTELPAAADSDKPSD